jgi:hypothetical protein
MSPTVPQVTGTEPGTAPVRCALYEFTAWTVGVTVRDSWSSCGVVTSALGGYANDRKHHQQHDHDHDHERARTVRRHEGVRGGAQDVPQTGGASIEQGRRFPPRAFVERAEEVLDAFGALRGVYKHVGREAGLASWFRKWAGCKRGKTIGGAGVTDESMLSMAAPRPS